MFRHLQGQVDGICYEAPRARHGGGLRYDWAFEQVTKAFEMCLIS
jgi:hypothetical protein